MSAARPASPTNVATQNRDGTYRLHTINPDGFCPSLGAWVFYAPDGTVVTIPAHEYAAD